MIVYNVLFQVMSLLIVSLIIWDLISKCMKANPAPNSPTDETKPPIERPVTQEEFTDNMSDFFSARLAQLGSRRMARQTLLADAQASHPHGAHSTEDTMTVSPAMMQQVMADIKADNAFLQRAVEKLEEDDEEAKKGLFPPLTMEFFKRRLDAQDAIKARERRMKEVEQTGKKGGMATGEKKED
ncbi:hypothetical protein J8273_5454 [Carpediemonas membranifera]|uniref:Uncharacterized protein n=1 Tax=Carpediemonas membranifera TaxID=201153 RepID=A0A8J6B410_9EUKA|nr:hypothetical protein J8273_5454 [Carpediemonas membranifera]|eukprot:KAG9392462.1 hypothetical protein J8273_5454 [Carpediemonas membranifera]